MQLKRAYKPSTFVSNSAPWAKYATHTLFFRTHVSHSWKRNKPNGDQPRRLSETALLGINSSCSWWHLTSLTHETITQRQWKAFELHAVMRPTVSSHRFILRYKYTEMSWVPIPQPRSPCSNMELIIIFFISLRSICGVDTTSQLFLGCKLAHGDWWGHLTLQFYLYLETKLFWGFIFQWNYENSTKPAFNAESIVLNSHAQSFLWIFTLSQSIHKQ